MLSSTICTALLSETNILKSETLQKAYILLYITHNNYNNVPVQVYLFEFVVNQK